MTIMPLKYIPADKFEARAFDGMMVFVGVATFGMVMTLVMDQLAVPYTGFFILYGVLSVSMLLIGWSFANLLAHIELDRMKPKMSPEEYRQYMESKGFTYKEA
jgi:predicted membrane channel-forming protein YqfA (hemolysin III family)